MGMRVKRYVWLCEDCLQPAVNDEWSSLDYHYTDEKECAALVKRIERGLRKLGPHLVPAYYDVHEDTGDESDVDVDYDFTEPCDCCGRAGLRYRKGYRFAILTKASKRYLAVQEQIRAALSYADARWDSLDEEEGRQRLLEDIMGRLHDAKLA